MTTPDPRADTAETANAATADGGWNDIVAGGVFLALAAGFAAEGLRYELGTPLRMGPGFIPVSLAGLLAAIGAVILFAGVLTLAPSRPVAEARPVPWRGFVTIVAAIVLFGVLAPRAGLIPVVFVCAFLSALASRRNGPLGALAIAAALTALSWGIFKVGLGITLPTFGPLFVG